VTRAFRGLLVLATVGLLLLLPQAAGKAESPHRGHGTVLAVVVDRVSFEDLMASAAFRRLASGGGAALMATNQNYRGNERAVFEALGSGSDPVSGSSQLMGRVLEENGVDVCVREGSSASGLRPPQPSSPMRFLGVGPTGDAACGRPEDPTVDSVLLVTDHSTADIDRLRGRRSSAERDRLRRQAIGTEGKVLEGLLGGEGYGSTLSGRFLFLVLTPSPSRDMTLRGDEVTPLIMVQSTNFRAFAASGSPRALRSDTTRQTGLVANVDVAPTILDFFGIPIPKEMGGQPIRVDGTVDLFHLHQLHLDQRRIRLPIQLGEVAFVAALGIVGIAALIQLGVRGSLPPRFGAVMRFLALCGAALPIPLIAGGLLPRLTYWVVVPFLVLTVVALAAAALSSRWPGPMGPFRFLGAVGLAFVVLDALFCWRGARIPLLGGTMFDGVRFYGLPNSFIALLLASALLVAVGLEPFTGFMLLLAAGLFAGFPNLGANVGAAITLFVAAGMWWALRTRRRFGLRELAFVAGTAAVGLAAVLLANRYLPGAPTHITGFVERTGGIGATWDTLRRRLDVGFGQIGQVPAAVIPLIGLVAVLGVVIARPAPIRSGLDLAGRVWREALIAMTVAGLAAFFVNDTGVAAAAPVFLYAMTALAYPAFLAARRS
jgi:hypothetical protein